MTFYQNILEELRKRCVKCIELWSEYFKELVILSTEAEYNS